MKQLVLLLSLLVIVKGFSQTTDTVKATHFINDVRNAYKASALADWKKASTRWEYIVSVNPVDGEYWYKLGESYYNGSEYYKAINAFKQSILSGDPPVYETIYFISKCYAHLNKKRESLDALEQAFNKGYRRIMDVSHDEAFSVYNSYAEFRRIVGLPIAGFKSRDEGWRFDLTLLVREIKRRAPNPYRNISERQFDLRINALDKKIPYLTDLQLIIEFMKVTTLVGDGHTMIYGFFERPEFQKNLPFDFFLFEEGLFITDADKRYEQLLGSKIIAMDNKPVEEILKGLDPILNRDNAIGPKVLGLFRMRTVPLLYGLGLVKNPDEIELTVKDKSGNITQLKIKADCPVPSRKLWDNLPDKWVSYYPDKRNDPPLYLSGKFTHYWFKYLPGNKTVYFQYNEIADDENNPFYKFCDSLSMFIEQNDVEKLIVDIRFNNGGNTMLVPYFIQKIIASRKINQTGRLFVITGRRTYSAAINLAGYFERFTNKIFVGEPTGSSPNFVGEDLPFQLPYSKLVANVSDMYWQTSWPHDQRQWFAPLLYVSPKFDDYQNGKDPCIDAILAYPKE